MMEGTGIKNKIIFLLLFVFSFIIIHDTVLDVIQTDHDSLITQSSDTNAAHKAYQPLTHLHSMFHFVALIESEYPVFESPTTQMSIASVFLAYLYHEIEEDERPPIV